MEGLVVRLWNINVYELKYSGYAIPYIFTIMT